MSGAVELEAGPQALEEKTVDAIRNNLRLHVSIDGVATVQGFEDAARAALAVVREELRESTTEMLDSGWDETPPAWTPELNESGPQVMARVFAAMLSASPLGDDHE